ncbi:MAG: prolyl oligopeptidase family serine peptidase [Candidatus Sumerlaeota bacterium]|nr:prolyl oligopeptidase family serine peptidase [Candidatus Sumerlaeota bacterium]
MERANWIATLALTLTVPGAGWAAAPAEGAGADSRAAKPSAPPATAMEGEWETLADGSLVKATTYRSADGLELGASIRKPAGDGPFPAVLWLSGGNGDLPAAQRAGRSLGHPIKDFVAAGWVVNTIQYRPPDAPTPNMDEREWDDTARALETLRAYPFVDAGRMALAGHSHGARVTTMMASRVDARCGVALAPATLNLVEMKTRQERGEPFAGAAVKMMDNMEQILGAKILDQPDLFLCFSPFSEVGKVKFPLLLMYAEDDSSGPAAIVKAYEEALRKAGKEVESYYPAKGGHGVYFGGKGDAPSETEETARRTVAFIQKHFGETR